LSTFHGMTTRQSKTKYIGQRQATGKTTGFILSQKVEQTKKWNESNNAKACLFQTQLKAFISFSFSLFRLLISSFTFASLSCFVQFLFNYLNYQINDSFNSYMRCWALKVKFDKAHQPYGGPLSEVCKKRERERVIKTFIIKMLIIYFF